MSDLRSGILTFGASLQRGTEGVQPLNLTPRRTVICGMGGSSVAGEVVATTMDVVIHRDAGLPADTTAQDLVICVSWSGNTAEVLASYDAARDIGASIAVITSGGQLAERAKAASNGFALLPANDLPPRLNAGLMTGALFALLGIADKLPTIDTAVLEAEGKRLATDIGTKTPVFYTTHPARAIGGFFKAMVNENTKRHAWASSFPSAAHNEIEGWQGPYQDSLIPVVIRTDSNASALDALLAMLKTKEYTESTIQVSGSDLLQQALTGYVLALWTSYHLAIHLGIDPEGTAWIDEFKQLNAHF